MRPAEGHVAIDLGASSGRVEVVSFDGETLAVDEVHRFANRPVRARGTLYWDALRLWDEVCAGIRRASSTGDCEVRSVGVDAWGVDYALLDGQGRLASNPVSYRDARTEGVMESVLAAIPAESIFLATGTQFMRANTLFQLVASQRDDPLGLDRVDRLLMMPDLFHYWLTGSAVGEFTVATTTQLLNASTRSWALDVLDRLDIPPRLLPELVEPATVLGRVDAGTRESQGLPDLAVALPASHDTASAVAAASLGPGSAYISCGTWSLIGVEVKSARMDGATLGANFTNEGGLAGTWRYLHNVAGLWLIEECRRAWASAGSSLSHSDVTLAATASPGWRSLIDVDDPALFQPADMPTEIRLRCSAAGQPVPETIGEVARCVLDSLASRYGETIRTVSALTGRQIKEIRLVGGGSRNELLCQLTADASGLPVYAGPAEATAIGNALGQMLAQGAISSLQQGRELVERSLRPRLYEPRDVDRPMR